MRVMDPREVIREIESYADRAGLKVSTVCQLAFGNSKYLLRLKARVNRLNDEYASFRKFCEMRERGPIPQPAASAAQTQEQNHVETSDGC